MAGATTLGVSHLVLHRRVSVTGAYRSVLARPLVGRLIAGGLLLWVATSGLWLLVQGLSALVPPITPAISTVCYLLSFWLGLRLFVFTQAVVLEKARVVEGFRRSWRLTAGHTLRVALAWILLGAGVGFVMVLMVVIFVIVYVLLGVEGVPAPETTQYVMALGFAAIWLLVLPPMLAVVVLQYYSLRCDAEGI